MWQIRLTCKKFKRLSLIHIWDLKNNDDVKTVIYLLADSVAARMRESGLNRALSVHVNARSADLKSYHKQGKTSRPTGNVREIAELAFKLFREIYPWEEKVRAMGVSVSDFYFGPEQLDFFGTISANERLNNLNEAVDKIRQKYGKMCIRDSSYSKDVSVLFQPSRDVFSKHKYQMFIYSLNETKNK